MSAASAHSDPEAQAREIIDAKLVESGWIIQNKDAINLAAGTGVAIREFVLKSGHGKVDYLLFVEGQAAGVLRRCSYTDVMDKHI